MDPHLVRRVLRRPTFPRILTVGAPSMPRYRLALVAGAASIVAIAAAGCGSTGQSPSTSAKPKPSGNPKSAKVQIQIAAPIADATVRAPRVVVRGTVTPADASVQITGLTAAVENGVFHRSIPVTVGSNNIDVVATKAGMDPVTAALSITRGQSEAQLAKARAAEQHRQAARKAARATRERAAAAR